MRFWRNINVPVEALGNLQNNVFVFLSIKAFVDLLCFIRGKTLYQALLTCLSYVYDGKRVRGYFNLKILAWLFGKTGSRVIGSRYSLSGTVSDAG